MKREDRAVLGFTWIVKLNPNEQQNYSYDGKFSFSAFSTGKENKRKKWLLGGILYLLLLLFIF